MTGLVVRDTPAGARFDARVTPRASRTGLDGVRDGRLIIRVTAPPVESAANDAVVALLSDALGVPKRNVALAAGAISRTKSIVVAGLSAADVHARLAAQH